ncbi:hypothetical protein [Flavobacterium sp.]|uniref:hypothetical protein n=1 Tax=Flavobacterium sp. TaxID=239 RepID=UPI003750DF28
MKKLFLLLMICVLTFVNAQTDKKTSATIETVYKDSKEGISTVYKDLKSTTPQIKSALESLSKELKTTTDSLWLILVKQQLVWSWGFLILIFSSIINWFLFYRKNYSANLKYEKVKVINQKLMFRDGKTEEECERHPSVYGKQYTNIEEEGLCLIPNSNMSIFKYVHLAICITLSVFSFLHFSDMLTGFINPEFGALKTITEVVQNLK